MLKLARMCPKPVDSLVLQQLVATGKSLNSFYAVADKAIVKLPVGVVYIP